MTRLYWILYCDAVIIFVILYYLTVYVLDNKYQAALFFRCDPYKYVIYFKIHRALCFFLRRNRPDTKISLAVGLRNKGQFANAKKVLCSIDPNKISSAEHLVLYYNNLCDLLYLMNDYTAALEALNNGFSALDKLFDVRLHEIWAHHLAVNLKSLQMRVGIFEGCEEVFSVNLEKAEYEYSKIEAHTNLGEYYSLTKQYHKALSHFDYIVQHGNKLFHVDMAKKYISEINKLVLQ